jgi:hypothetical protein
MQGIPREVEQFGSVQRLGSSAFCTMHMLPTTAIICL